jgi:ABC-type multidrug transport system fused ATPase/permease subunit
MIFYIIRGIYVVFYNYAVNRYSFNRQHVIASKLFEKYLDLPYVIFTKKNSSDLTKALITETYYYSLLLNQLLFFFSEIILLILLYSLLMIVQWEITVIISISIGLLVFILTRIVSGKSKQQGINRESLQGKLFRIINEALRNFKIIKLSANKHGVVNRFIKISESLSHEFASHRTLSSVPRNVMETIGFTVLMLIFLYFTFINQSITAFIPIISTFVLALFRMMPAANRIIIHYNNILYSYHSLDILFNELQQPIETKENDSLTFNKSIKLKNISFKYQNDGQPILNNISFTIQKGSKVGIIGESGSGKSTLIDLIITMLRPTSGEIFVDNVKLDTKNLASWRQKIGYIPQDIYLFDGTAAENISFGYNYDEQKIAESLSMANIYDFLNQEEGLKTLVGEDGILLSGGQKQRIGIARALYGDPEILIFDEATSALDNETEAKIIEEIFSIGRDKTMIIVAHRPSMIKNCNVVYKLVEGRLMLI